MTTETMNHPSAAPTNLSSKVLRSHTLGNRRQDFAVEPNEKGHPSTLMRDQLQRLLAAIQREYPQLDIHEAQGITTFESDGLTLRIANEIEQGVLVVELIDLANCDRWDAYWARKADGTFRTGWHRSTLGVVSEPDQWLAAVADLTIVREVEPQATPDFIALIAAISSSTPITYAQSDAQQVREIQDEVEQLRQLTALQAGKLRVLADMQSRTPEASAPEAQEPRKWQLDELAEWAAENADRITILPRAINAARKSLYEQPQLVYAALELLASTYRKVKLGQQERTDLIDEVRALGMEIGGSVDPSRATKDYFVRWGRTRRALDQHLSRGVSRDPRLCMRIYYFWCDETERVVVGWLPSHLDNSLS
ncbi:hypothetical protein [Hydrogenophaga sp.]|uniref:hypothetical protein n=1 Tax=Hydrogenophaga sp. TaxID=1904254 RepID=UPI00271714BF|nr:hypothetical protein [Hydrogenophaga sp.]MDO9133989.1 hypothetical protein [Hydrogenophaga sp.]